MTPSQEDSITGTTRDEVNMFVADLEALHDYLCQEDYQASNH